MVVCRLGQLTQPSESTGFHTSGRLRMSCCGATRRTRTSPRPRAAVSASPKTTRLSVQSRNGRRRVMADAIGGAAPAVGKRRSVMTPDERNECARPGAPRGPGAEGGAGHRDAPYGAPATGEVVAPRGEAIDVIVWQVLTKHCTSGARE